MEEREVEPYYMARAKELTNILYDKRFIADSVSRESIDGLEKFIGFLFQSHCDSAVKCAQLSMRLRDVNTKKID